jgi:hypothetical protein
VLLHVGAGGALVAVALLIDAIQGREFRLGRVQGVVLAAGLVLLAAAALRPSHRAARWSSNVCLVVLAALASALLGEALSRVVGFDFAREQESSRHVPPFYREPRVPTGAVFFRREGPERWTGPVLRTRLEQLDLSPDPYRDEVPITVEYDAQGFRNPEGLTDWEVAVAGDSFTELGHLPHAELFTTLLGERIGARVRNLGTSHTGPLTHLSYLTDYGRSRSTRITVIVFFEGDDLDDLMEEHAALARFQATGERGTRGFRPQTSVLRAALELAETVVAGRSGDRITAYLPSPRGEIPQTLGRPPPGTPDLSRRTVERLEWFLRRYAQYGRTFAMEPWLAYMPAKIRVLHGAARYAATAPAELRSWQPTDLPGLVESGCRRAGIRFVDLTPALVEETRRGGEPVFNSVHDTHLTGRGSAVVALELASHLRRPGP